MQKVCYIVGAGDFTELKQKPSEGDFIIAADGGFDHLKRIGLEPDLVIGDFDSVEEIPEHHNRIILPKEKDDTDMWAALKEGMHLGYETFYIYGGLGGRLAHTMANIQTLAWLSEHGRRGFLIGEDITVTSITNDEFSLEAGFGKVSMFAHSQKAKGVCIHGMKYPLTDATVMSNYPIGISNERMGCKASISVMNGTLIIMYQ